MNNVEGLSSSPFIVTDKTLVQHEYDTLMVDRIINVRFIRKYPDRQGRYGFSLRSDYEPVCQSNGKISFIKCGQKPSISLSYQQVADNVAIEVDLVIPSMFIDSTVAGDEIDSGSGNPVVWAIIQLGYFDQFKRWDRVTEVDDLTKFYDFGYDPRQEGAKEGAELGGRQLFVQILTARPEGNPPERKWVFKGVVATLETGLRWEESEDMLKPGYGVPDFPSAYSKIEAMLFQWITRRFIKSTVLHQVLVETKELEDGTKVQESNIYVYGYATYFNNAIVDKTWTKLVLAPDGLMTVNDANALGVLCACSEALRTMPNGDLARNSTLGEEASKDTLADYSLFDDIQSTLAAQINAVKQQYEFIRFYMMPTGSIYFYSSREDTASLLSDPTIKAYQASKIKMLPAVYDITVSGTRIIRCPFYRVIDPMTTVIFQSRYRTIDETGFWYQPKKGYSAYLVLLCSIKFSTVEDDNEMVLTCVDVDEDNTPIIDPSTGIVTIVAGEPRSAQGFTTNIDSQQRERNKAWSKALLTAGQFPLDASKARWIDIANSYLLSGASAEDWVEEKPTLAKALADLKEWNSDGVWTTAREKNAEGISPENRLVSGLGFIIPWLYVGDTITLKIPYKPSYDSSFEGEEKVING